MMDIALFCTRSNSCIKYLGELKWKAGTALSIIDVTQLE